MLWCVTEKADKAQLDRSREHRAGGVRTCIRKACLSFEKSRPGRGTNVIPAPDVPAYALPVRRAVPPVLPELAECDVDRHYTELAQKTFGVNCGFYPLGSCTMKYNPAVNEAAAALPGFSQRAPARARVRRGRLAAR